jgi:hypothetical protein
LPLALGIFKLYGVSEAGNVSVIRYKRGDKILFSLAPSPSHRDEQAQLSRIFSRLMMEADAASETSQFRYT